MNNDWTDILRDKLAEHMETPPEGLWSEIDAALKPKRKSYSLRLWIYAAAACALLTIGLSFIYDKGETEQLLQTAQLEKTSQKLQTKQQIQTTQQNPDAGKQAAAMLSPKPSANPVQIFSANPSAPVVAKQTIATAPKDAEPAAESSKQTEETLKATEELQEQAAESHKPTAEPQKPAEETKKPVARKPAAQPADNALLAYDAPTKQKRKGKAGLSVFASNFMMSSASNDEFFMSSGPLGDHKNPFTPTGPGNPNNPNGNPNGTLSDPNNPDGGDKKKTRSRCVEVAQARYAAKDNGKKVMEAKHQQPLRLGMSLSLPVSERLSVTAGLQLSRLVSEITYTNYKSRWTETQKLIYLGVPVAVTYDVLEYYPVNIYLTAGGMAERCLSGEERRLQFSLFGGGGVQIQLAKFISVYAEPLATYYPDNHSEIINVYKDKPLNFDFRLGLRLNLNK